MTAFVLPKLYSQNAAINLFSAKYMLKKYKYLIKWKNDTSILEFGVGDGSNSRKCLWPLLPNDYKKLVVTDLSKAMLDFVKSGKVLPRTVFCELDIACQSVPLHFQSKFDYIFSFLALMYAKNPIQAFKNIHTMLKPNGQTFHVFLPSLPTDPLHQSLSKHPKWGKYGHEKMISPFSNEAYPEKRYEKALKEGGFKSYKCETENLTYTFPNEETWKGFFISVNTAIANIPNEEIQDYKKYFLDRIKNEVLNVDPKDKNKLQLKYNVSVFYATKTNI